jgi:hypothetical protein
MPHPKALSSPQIPKYSEIVRPNDVPFLESPLRSERTAHLVPGELPLAPVKQPFNPRVAAYSVAAVAIIIAGAFIGAQSKSYFQAREQLRAYRALPVEGKIAQYSLQRVSGLIRRMEKLREEILKRKERLDDQLAIIRLQKERDSKAEMTGTTTR